MPLVLERHPYLDHNFAPIQDEITAPNLSVIGELPSDLSGWFVRNGPNPQFSPIGPHHWFDGDGMLHSVKIAHGKATYRNRYVQTTAFTQEKLNQAPLWTGLLAPPQTNNPYGVGKNCANTSLVFHHGHLLALWEGGRPYQINPLSLETLGEYDFEQGLTSNFTAHPKVDPITGEMMFFGYSVSQSPYLHYGVVSAQGELLRVVPIDLPVGVMMHDFAITENYSIIMDLPLTFRESRLHQGQLPFQFERSHPSRFGILPRHGDNSTIRWFTVPPCYVLHTLNAYEEGDEVVLIAGRMDTINLLSFSDMAGAIPDAQTVLSEWRFNLKTGKVKEKTLSEHWVDFPRINEQCLGRKMRYGYTAQRADGTLADRERFLFDGLIKYDFAPHSSGTPGPAVETHFHEFGPSRYGGEAVFVPRPQSKAEDDGWLLSLVYDETTELSELVILDAMAMDHSPIARILIPQRIPYGFHGIWLERSQVLKSMH